MILQNHLHEKEVEEVSDNDYESEENGSESSDYEKHSDTDDEDTEEARSEIGEDSNSEDELERQNNENPIVDTNPPVNIPDTALELFQLFFTENLLQETTETDIFGAEKIQKATPLQKNSIRHK
ncbi:hypothetical protein JTB14_014465 [Gonioctena quinquepunctata]|nr:hypothetical protein JTB14_014465 [Gonioctena quinquepunctata]